MSKDTFFLSEEQTEEQKRVDLTAFYWPIGQLKPSPNNMRQRWSDEAVEERKNSIIAMRAEGRGHNGILEPLTVRFEAKDFRADGSLKETAIGTIHRGGTRYKAAILAGLGPNDTVPIRLSNLSDEEARGEGLHSNLHHTQPDPLDYAVELEKIKQAKGFSIQELANYVAKPRSWVQNHLDLLRLADDVRVMINTTSDSMEAAIRINAVKDEYMRSLLIQMRLQGASLDFIRAMKRIESAPQPLRGLLLVWAEKQWKAALKRQETLNVEEFNVALRSEARTHGFVVEKQGKNFKWREIVQESKPVLNDEGEFTGFAGVASLPFNEHAAPPVLTLVKPLTPAEQWHQLSSRRESRTVRVPQQNTADTLAQIARIVADLARSVQGVESLPYPTQTRQQLAAVKARVRELEDAVESRIPFTDSTHGNKAG